jgi:hypothetical protein
MHKVYLVLFALACLPTCLSGQTLKLEWADEIRLKGWTEITPLGQANDRLYFLVGRSNYETNEFELLSYDKKLTDPQQKTLYKYIIPTRSYDTPSVFFNSKTQKVSFIRNRVYTTSREIRTTINTYSFGAEHLVKEKVIAKLSYEGGNASQSISNIVPSHDSSLVAVYQVIPAKRLEPEQLYVQVFSNDFDALVWERNVQLPHAAKDATLENAVVDKDGNLFLLYEIKEQQAARTAGAAKFFKSIFVVSPKAEPYEYVVKLAGQEIESVGIGTDDKGDLLVSGFYGEKGKLRNSSGLFTFTLNAQTQETGASFQKTIPDLYASDIGNRKKYEYRFRKAYVIDDASSQLLLAEQYLFYVVTNYNQYGTGGSTFHYVYGPAAIIKLNADQDVEWVRRVPKLQHTVNDGGYFSSYYSFLYNDNAVLVYNDDPSNLTVLEDARYNDLDQSRRMKTAAVMAAVVGPDGKLTKQLLQAYDPELGANIIPKSSQRIDDKTHLVVARWRKDYRLGRLIVGD